MQAMDIGFWFIWIPISVPYSVGACREMEYIWDKWELGFTGSFYHIGKESGASLHFNYYQ